MPSSSGGLAIQQFNYMATGPRQFATVQPGATAADNVLGAFTIPAGYFDGFSGKGLRITAFGTLAANTQVKTVKLIYNPATAVIGSTVGTGGTTILTTGALSAAVNTQWYFDAIIADLVGSNNQQGIGLLSWFTTTALAPSFIAMVAPATITADETAAINIALTGNAATATTDISMLYFNVVAL